MTDEQADALYGFLENVDEEFSLKKVVSVVKAADSRKHGRLAAQIARVINTRRLAFSTGTNTWVTRRVCFSHVKFVITPTRLELLNGILIPGHRCIPFANPDIVPHQYTFYWKGKPLAMSTTEGAPEDFYPYYSIYGEEYAPQFVAGNSPENEEAFNADPYEDPAQVSMQTVDMRQVFREAAFVPGDSFVAEIMDWKAGSFALEKVAKGSWPESALEEWLNLAEESFLKTFETLGPGASPEEQCAFAYWLGGERMRTVPAYSLEEFFYERTDKIETVAFGIESRFWYAGRELTDFTRLEGAQTQCDRTPIEDILWRAGVPVSEFVIQAYVRDALFYREKDVDKIALRIVPSSIQLDKWDWNFLAAYIIDMLEEWRDINVVFTDQHVGPLRRRAAELHTAVIGLAAYLAKSEFDHSWLPMHTFIILSQIQNHAAMLLEDMGFEDGVDEDELASIENTIDSMIETFDDTQEMIDQSIANFRRSNITLLKNESKNDRSAWRTVQLGIGGTDVWRRIDIPQSFRLEECHSIIQALFGWKNSFPHRFTVEYSSASDIIDAHNVIKTNMSLEQLASRGITEILYEYGKAWTVKLMMLSRREAGGGDTPRCLAGANAAPPESIEGPLRFRRFVSALELEGKERETAVSYLGDQFDPAAFSVEDATKRMEEALST